MITPYGAAAATPPIRVLVLYYSSYGHIEAMASAEAEGAKQAGVDVVVKRVPDADAYARAEPGLLEQLIEVRRRFIEADLGEGIATPFWPAQ